MTEDPATLLVVDDDEMNRDMLSRRLRRKGYEVEVAHDGQRALEMIALRPFDLVLLDVMMPGLDGLEVLTIVRQTHAATDLPVIMATAKDKSEDVVAALGLGANDYVTKPLDFPVVLARIQTQLALRRAVEQVRALERSLAERNRELEAANERMSRDLRAAAKVQAALLPAALPDVPGAAFAWAFRPCTELAGDGLNVVRLDDRFAGFYVLDVSGHGVAAALLSVSLARALAPTRPGFGPGPGRRRPDRAEPLSPAEVAERLDRLFPYDPATEQYATLLYGILDAATGSSATSPPVTPRRPTSPPAGCRRSWGPGLPDRAGRGCLRGAVRPPRAGGPAVSLLRRRPRGDGPRRRVIRQRPPPGGGRPRPGRIVTGERGRPDGGRRAVVRPRGPPGRRLHRGGRGLGHRGPKARRRTGRTAPGDPGDMTRSEMNGWSAIRKLTAGFALAGVVLAPMP
ncbi:MAG: response regulator [Singulisphaera sp.]